MFLDLPDCPARIGSGGSEKLLKSFKSKLRSQIKKPEKDGLRFEWGILINWMIITKFFQLT